MVKHNNELNDKFTIENNYYFQLFSITPYSGTIIQNDDKLMELLTIKNYRKSLITDISFKMYRIV